MWLLGLYFMCGHNIVAEQIWVLVQARFHLLAETLRRQMDKTKNQATYFAN